VKQKLLHLIAALLVGILLAGLPAICSVFVLNYFNPSNADDAGFHDVGAIVFGVIIYLVSVPIVSILTYFVLRKFSIKKGC
jgi:energy-converting hydrogenase Eha subunit B